MIRIARPALSAAELADYTDHLSAVVTFDAPDLLAMLFGRQA